MTYLKFPPGRAVWKTLRKLTHYSRKIKSINAQIITPASEKSGDSQFTTAIYALKQIGMAARAHKFHYFQYIT